LRNQKKIRKHPTNEEKTSVDAANHKMNEAIAHETKSISSRICYNQDTTILKFTNLEDCITGAKR